MSPALPTTQAHQGPSATNPPAPDPSAPDPLVRRMRPFGTTVFAEMTALAQRHDAVNLGQGFPDTEPPQQLREVAMQAIASGPANQYAPGSGFAPLLQAVAAHQEHWYGLRLDPATQVLATAGATEAVAASVLALCEPGDEVVVLEPYYDSYAASIALAGAVRRTAVLRFPDFGIDEDALRAAFSDRTRMVLLNNPHNPTGRVFSRAELELVARLATEHDAWVVSDEVYEHLVFDGRAHTPVASLPGMAGRTLTISSGGKTFNATGWKVGWLTGPAAAVTAVRMVKQFLTFTTSGAFQFAVAEGLGLPDEHFAALADGLQRRRDLVAEGLQRAGFEVSLPAGTYFVVADAAPLGVRDATQFCRELPERVGVAAVPVRAFHDDPDAGASLVRFAVCKREPVLQEAMRRLRALP